MQTTAQTVKILGLTIKQILARNAKRAPHLAQEGSVRLQKATTRALRFVPATLAKDVYPCVFCWEITDARLRERYLARQAELNDRQKAWYLNRLGFRAVAV